MDSVRPPTAIRRTGSLLALALLAGTALSVLPSSTAVATAPSVDVVVTSTSAGVGAVADAVRAVGGTVRDALPLAGGVSADLPAGVVLPPPFSVVPNSPVQLASEKVVGGDREATAVREALGLGRPDGEGKGITIAVVDTGVADVPGLRGRVRHVDVSGSWTDGELHDAYGHGTFVAGVAAGAGDRWAGDEYAGVAPAARVLDVRVADEAGSTDLVTVLRGLEAARGADVVNLSMSSGSPLPYQLDPLAAALDRLWSLGVVVVVPTGNDGPGRGSVTSPGSDPTLLTVGALDERLTADRRDDTVPAFSGRGPAPQGVAKPDLVAPGTSLVSLRAPGSVVDRANPGSVVEGTHFRGSGTSFATAAVSGAAAALLAERGDLRPDQVKALVTSTAYDAKGLRDVRDSGAGGLDLEAAADAQTPQVADAVLDAPPAGEEAVWRAFLQALMDDDPRAAASSWARLSPAAHKWAANSWSAHKWAANSWSAHKWGAHKWASSGSAEEWDVRLWAAHKWAAHKWAAEPFVAHKWAAEGFVAHKWAAHKWAAHKWAGDDVAADEWAASSWAASTWGASKWAADWS